MHLKISRALLHPNNQLYIKSVEAPAESFLAKKGISHIDTYFNPDNQKVDKVILRKTNGKMREYSYFEKFPDNRRVRIFGKGKNKKWVKTKTPVLQPVYQEIKGFFSFLKIFPEAIIAAVKKEL